MGTATFFKLKLAVVSAAVALGVMTTTSRASATVITCTPTSVGWDNNAGGSFNVLCSDGIWYHAWVNGTVYGGANCPSFPLEMLKIWSSLVQSAILSGKKLKVDYTVYNNFRVSTWWQLDK